ncbi:MAG: murein hydrolase activator EnvC [Actinomycetota bacterium]
MPSLRRAPIRPSWRWLAAPLALVACLATVALPAAAGLQDRQEVIEAKSEKLEAEIAKLNDQAGGLLQSIGKLDSSATDLQTEVDGLDARIALLTARIGTKEAELTRAQQRLALLTDQLQSILTRLDERRSVFADRAIAAYMAGPTAYMDGLLSSESFADLIDRYEYYESATDADAALIQEIEVLSGEVEGRRRSVEEKQQQILLAKTQLEGDRSEVAAIRAERAASLTALNQILDQKRGVLGDIQSDKSEKEEVLAQFERESQRISAILAGASSTSAPVRGGGQLLWPAAGPVTSGYGYRTHPIFGDRRLHAGIDIGASYGAQVIAADAGSVVFAGAMSGYGNAIVVDHGGGFATTYNHLSAFSVGSGQEVGRGTPIGAVGCSGYCTGPHLHFEVRVDGSPVDPMPYLQ